MDGMAIDERFTSQFLHQQSTFRNPHSRMPRLDAIAMDS